MSLISQDKMGEAESSGKFMNDMTEVMHLIWAATQHVWYLES